MSSAETPDDRDEPPFKFKDWLIKVAALMGTVAAVLTLTLHFYQTPVGHQAATVDAPLVKN